MPEICLRIGLDNTDICLRIGLDTAKAVLDLDKEDLIKRADLEESTIDEVISTLKKEFE